MDVKQELKYVIKKHKNDKLETFQTNISDMASACLREIERLEDEIDKSYKRGFDDGLNSDDMWSD